VAQASRGLNIAESELRRWIREVMAAPVKVFFGNGLQRAEMAEIAVLKKTAADQFF
jgi:transposase